MYSIQFIILKLFHLNKKKIDEKLISFLSFSFSLRLKQFNV
jgi:hypothetical protein